MTMNRNVLLVAFAGLVCTATNAVAQLDPLLYLKKNKPNVLIAVETANRMQRDVYDDYLDANIYKRTGAAWEAALGITDLNTSAGNAGRYRRKYVDLAHTDPNLNGGDKFQAAQIEIVGNLDPAYNTFDARTRVSIARRALIAAITANTAVANFTLFRTRQQAPAFEIPAAAPAETYKINEGPVRIVGNTALAMAQKATDDNGTVNKWNLTRPVVGAINGSIAGPVAPLSRLNDDILTILNKPTGDAGSLLPAGRDSKNDVDAPLDNMLDDIKKEAETLIAADPNCANTVAVIIVGGGEGNTSNEDPVSKAKLFLNISARRVPIYVIGIAPFSADERTQLQNIAAASGGQYTEITPEMFEAAGVGNPVPELVRAVNVAVSHGFANPTDFNKPPDATHPYGFSTEHQVTSPIVGTINLENARDINGIVLDKTVILHPVTSAKIPQRSNVMITAGYSLPGFDGKLRAIRVYMPVADATKPIGYKFSSEGDWERRLWVASAPDAASRNIYTALPDGTVVAFTSANAAALRQYLRAGSDAEAAAIIDFVRQQPLGAVIGSTPALMDPPSLDPPPDAAYPGFADANKNRRSIVWVGLNDGMLHAIDGRLGKEVWAFVPFNLLPKLTTLRSGQAVGDFRFFMDGSPKVADVKVGGTWRTYLVVGQGAGGTFYQTFDVTLDDMAVTVGPDSDDLAKVLTYFSSADAVPLKWSFPRYEHFDVNAGVAGTWSQWGDIAAGAPAIAKSVGETWSDPAVGQVETAAGRFVVITGSGFFRYSIQQQAHRNKAIAGTTFYILDAADGTVLDSRDVGSDKMAEDVDNCAAIKPNDCRKLKNALQADPVATGPADSRYITKAYIGDLDGRIWRFDLGLDAASMPVVKQQLNLYTIDKDLGSPAEHPLFSSMALVTVGTTQPYLFVGTGSDLLPQNSVSTQYALLVILDEGPSGVRKGVITLEKTDGLLGDEKVSAFPAVAGDIVFFSTTTYKVGGCALPDANLYAFTFIGGPAYDTSGDGVVCSGAKCKQQDSAKVRTVAGSRATAPFIVDQHLVFGTGGNIEMFGDPNDFNNGVGQAGVRILSWREVR
jgi:hypothetical protein